MDLSFYEREADGSRYFSVMKSRNNRTPTHFHNAMEIIAVTEGKERVVINGDERVLAAGEIGICNSLDVHYYDVVGQSAVTVVMLSEEYTARYKEIFGGRLPNFLPAGGAAEELLALIETLYARQGGNRLVLSGYVDVFLGTLHDAAPPDMRAGADFPRAAEILRYLDDNFAGKLTLRSVADRFGYSANYFSALFNRFTGMHFRDYLNRLRISRTARLLESGKRVADVLSECGFESPNTYYRAAKKWKN